MRAGLMVEVLPLENSERRAIIVLIRSSPKAERQDLDITNARICLS